MYGLFSGCPGSDEANNGVSFVVGANVLELVVFPKLGNKRIGENRELLVGGRIRIQGDAAF